MRRGIDRNPRLASAVEHAVRVLGPCRNRSVQSVSPPGLASRLSFQTGAVANDHLDPWMRTQAVDQWLGLAGGEHVDRFVSFQVDEDGGPPPPRSLNGLFIWW